MKAKSNATGARSPQVLLAESSSATRRGLLGGQLAPRSPSCRWCCSRCCTRSWGLRHSVCASVVQLSVHLTVCTSGQHDAGEGKLTVNKAGKVRDALMAPFSPPNFGL